MYFSRNFLIFIAHFRLLLTHKLFIVGDFNFHIEDSSDTSAPRLKELLDICNLGQYVTSLTHIKGHILALVILILLINSVNVDYLMTDHVSILSMLNLKKPPPLRGDNCMLLAHRP